MNKEKAKELLPIIAAFVKGKTIECKVGLIGWRTVIEPTWSDGTEYRIKPEPKLVPFTEKDNIIGKVVITEDGIRAMITGQRKEGVYIGGGMFNTPKTYPLITYPGLLKTCKFDNGLDCGNIECEK
jgi:hypothetical protein